jgi:hypothetical protein
MSKFRLIKDASMQLIEREKASVRAILMEVTMPAREIPEGPSFANPWPTPQNGISPVS